MSSSFLTSLDERLQELKRRQNPLYRDIKTSHLILDEFEKDNNQTGVLAEPDSNPLFFFWLSHARQIGYVDSNFSHVYNVPYSIRQEAIEKYSCAIPTEKALSVILEYGKKVLEIGSGSGYWALLLQKMGADITAVDNGLSKIDPIYFPKTKKIDGISYLGNNYGCSDSILLLVWPHYQDIVVNLIVSMFQGKYLILVGERGNGCTWSMFRYEKFIEEVRQANKKEEEELKNEQQQQQEEATETQNINRVELEQEENKDEDSRLLVASKMMDAIENIIGKKDKETEKEENEPDVILPIHDQLIVNGPTHGQHPFNQFKLIRRVMIPTWKGIYDVMLIYEQIPH